MPPPTLLLMTGLPGSGKTSLAEALASELEAAVVGHDWVMAALRAQPKLWSTMADLDHVAFRRVGWSVMWNVGTAQLRAGRSVILDGVARTPEVAATRDVAQRSGCRAFVTLCSIDDARLHRERVVGRVRAIPDWPELTWEDVERSRAAWEPPQGVDLVLDTGGSFESTLGSMRSALGSSTGGPR